MIDIDRKVDREVPDCIPNFLNYAIRACKRKELYDVASEERKSLRTNSVYLTGLNPLKARLIIVSVVCWTGKGGTDCPMLLNRTN